MSKTNWRVVIYLREKGDYSCGYVSGIPWDEGEAQRECEELRSQVLRHVDVGGMNPAGHVYVEYDEDDA